jgi:hypothetical protein
MLILRPLKLVLKFLITTKQKITIHFFTFKFKNQSIN